MLRKPAPRPEAAMFRKPAVRLTEDGDGTTLRLQHTAPHDPGRWAEFGPGAVGVACGGSEEGRSFMTASSAAWAEAAIAGGGDEAAARATAARTTAAYTAVEAPPEATT